MFIRCPKCNSLAAYDSHFTRYKCLACEYLFEKKVNHYDDIQNMTLDEMSIYFAAEFTCPPGKNYFECRVQDEQCISCWKEWLKEEVD